MDKEKVTKWFNRLVRATKTLVNTAPYGKLQTCTNWTTNYHGKQVVAVHIYDGLHEASEVLGLELDLYQEDDEYKWYGMMYKDVLFFQLEENEPERRSDNV